MKSEVKNENGEIIKADPACKQEGLKSEAKKEKLEEKPEDSKDSKDKPLDLSKDL